MGKDSVEKEFLGENIRARHISELIARTDYFFLHNIKECIEKSELENGVYLSELAGEMRMSVTDTSKAVKGLEEKGYVTWKLDEDKKKTYIILTDKAYELERGQKRKLLDLYEQITANIRKEDMEVTMLTLSKIRQLLEDSTAVAE